MALLVAPVLKALRACAESREQLRQLQGHAAQPAHNEPADTQGRVGKLARWEELSQGHAEQLAFPGFAAQPGHPAAQLVLAETEILRISLSPTACVWQLPDMALWTRCNGKDEMVPWFGSMRGLDAFICSNGPSIAGEKTAALCGPGRVVIGLNNVYPRVRPDIWIGMDTPECFPASLLLESFPKIWRGNYSPLFHDNAHLRDRPACYFADVADKQMMFPIVADQHFVWERNTLAVAIHFAMWLGCHTIHLVGCDLDTRVRDYADNTRLTKRERKYNQHLYDEIFEWLRALKSAGYNNGFKLVSCSTGSRINTVMPYLPLVQALAQCASRVPVRRKIVHALKSTAAT